MKLTARVLLAMRSKIVFSTLFAGTAALALVGCRDGLGPNLSAKPELLRPTAPRWSLLNYSTQLPVTSATDPYYRISLPDIFADPTVVELTVAGLLTAKTDPKGSTMFLNNDFDATGGWSSGDNTCYANVTFTYVYSGSSVGWGPGSCVWEPNKKVEPYSKVMVVRGTGTVQRAVGFREYTNECGYQVRCHSYSGSQSISVRVLPGSFKLTASKREVVLNENVTFKALADPLTISGVPVPVKPIDWEWVPTAGGTAQTAACGDTWLECTRPIKESGTMTVTAIVQTVTRKKSVTVTVARACTSPVLTQSVPIATQFGAVDATHPKPHLGRDYAANLGTPVYAPEAGTVVVAGPTGKAGIAVVVKSSTVNSYFFHLSSKSVSTGQTVAAGTLLGHVGNTGRSFGYHLHFEQHAPGPIWDKGGRPPRSTAIAPCVF